MNTIFNPKKALFVAIFLALATFSGAPRVEAQVASTTADIQIEELKNTLIALLTQMIADLQAQIAELVSQQTVTQTTLGAIQTQVESSQIESVESTLSVSVGTPICKADVSSVSVPLSITGKSWSRATVSFSSYASRNNAPDLSSPRKQATRIINSSDPLISVPSWDDTYTFSISVDDSPSTNHEVVVENCQ